MDNVESAAAAGDSFPTTGVLSADGVISLIGCLLGNPFINAVYIGHPGWKAMGGRVGYSAATGVVVLVLTWLGIVALVSNLIPVVAILPILLYIGMLIGSQAFQESPKAHAPAIILAMIPQIAAWGKTMIDGATGAAGTNAAAVGMAKLGGGQFSIMASARSAAARRSPGSSSALSPSSSSTGNSRKRRRRAAHILRRRGDRRCPVAGRRSRLSRRRGDAVRLRPLRTYPAGCTA